VILGHRGSPKERPENTLESFQLALDEGADGVELDVLQCATGEIVVIHDPELSRLANVNAKVGEVPWTLLRELDVGSHLDSSFADARIPRLTDVFEALPKSALVNVELKGDGWSPPSLAREVAKILRATPHPERVLVSSFDPFLLRAFHRAAPEFPLGWLFAEDQWLGGARATLAPILHACAVHPSVQLCTAAALRRWKGRGYGICAWTVDDASAGLALVESGVEVLITNRPGRMKAALG
jgi:glycerophosphoryl diester phosphodiesterase